MSYRQYFMTIAKQKDAICNVILPVIAGSLFYLLPPTGQLLQFLRNYLPDGLWAYAFFSCILIIWQRHINFAWILITILIVTAFELLQSQHIIRGTGDFFDLVIYLVFGGIALFTNKYFILKFNSKSKPL